MNRRQDAPPRAIASSTCLLCGDDGDEVDRVDVQELVSRWRTRLSINISRELKDVDSISEHRCRRCGLLYFLPAAAGSEHLYRSLQRLPWYYAEGKWEHRAALRDIPANAAVLEVGCGFGSFLDLVQEKRHADAKGIDLSSAAIAVGRSHHRPVQMEDVADLAAREPESYDVVCAFQVLEHVPDPRSFLESCVRLLKPGGRLCLGVPNNDGYLGKQNLDEALLNQPPHHVTRWSPRTLASLSAMFPLQVRRIAFEPLEPQHVWEYISARLHPVDRVLRRKVEESAIGVLLSLVLTRLGLRRLLRGHTVYASYTRLPFRTARMFAGLASETVLASGFPLIG